METETPFDDDTPSALHDGHPTRSSVEQEATETRCSGLLLESAGDEPTPLARVAHEAYLLRALEEPLGAQNAGLDASRAWLSYWTLHSLDVLRGGGEPSARVRARLPAVVELLRACLAPEPGGGRAAEDAGGFGGAPGHAPHTASTYAAVLALLASGEPEALRLLAKRRAALHAHFLALKEPATGAFRVHAGGEADVRGAYTVLAVASLLGVLSPQLREGVETFLLRCQTYEGGFAAEPGGEAHGGYTFCALAGLAILGPESTARIVDAPALARWLALRQTAVEGGFSGRTNKLVDGCYSFWQGACFALLPRGARGAYDRLRLQRYVLRCCQMPEGGFCDKPGKSRDHYHTAYCLSGLSVAQDGADEIYGGEANRLPPVSPIYGLRQDRVDSAMIYFAQLFPAI
jgi:protein farnesyltransferase subunit beta